MRFVGGKNYATFSKTTSNSPVNIIPSTNAQYNDVSNQQDATTFSFIVFFKSALHVSGNKFTHPQEHLLTVYTAFGHIDRQEKAFEYNRRTQYCAGDEIETNEMGRARDAYGGG